MASLPTATTTLEEAGGGFAGVSNFIVILAAAALNADSEPRVFANADDIIDMHEYAPGVDYAAMHIEATGLPVIYCALPIATAGTIGRQDDEGVSGTCDITPAAGDNGVLEEVDAVLEVLIGGTIGTDAITFDLSLDGGRSSKRVRLASDATSYTIPYVGIVLNFGGGTLIAGDVYTFTTTAPMWDSDGLDAAVTALAAQTEQVRTWMVIGDLEDSDAADDVVGAVNSYDTTHKRFVQARAQIRDRLPPAAKSKVLIKTKGSPSLTFAAAGDTITRATGSWIDDGFAVGDVVTVSGAVASAGANNVTGPITVLTDTVMTLGSNSLTNEGPIASATVVGSEGLVFAASGDTITRSRGSWTADGFRDGDEVTITGAVASAGANNVTQTIQSLSATVMTLTALVDETIGSFDVTVTKGETMPAWMASMKTEFESVAVEKRINLGAGRARKASPISKWRFRRPAQWAVSIREYQKDVQVPTWRKDDGPLSGWDLTDGNGKVVEYDERLYEAALDAGFTCLRTWGNGPKGTFVADDITRADESTVMLNQHNMAVINLAMTINQKETENMIGRIGQLKPDGTARESFIRLLEGSINKQLEKTMLSNSPKEQVPMCSSVRWSASRDDDLSGPEPHVTGKLRLNLNGTVHDVDTKVLVNVPA